MKRLTESQFEDLIQPILTREKVELCGVKVSNNRTNPLIQVFVDYAEGYIPIGHCSQLIRQIQSLLDMSVDVMPAYRLEVSSPGVDFPLTQMWQFRKNISRLIRFNSIDVGGGQGDPEEAAVSISEGRILSVSDDAIICVELPDGKTDFTLNELSGAKVVIELFSKKNKQRKRNEKRRR